MNMTEENKTKQLLRLLFWESTIKCNLRCAHCRRVDDDSTAHLDMTTAQAKGMIDQLAEVGKDQPFMPILVFSGGEPLCREDLFELVDYAGDLKIRAALATNGTLVDSAVAQRIKDSGIARVSVSLDGADAQTHDKLRQLEGSFDDDYVSEMRAFLDGGADGHGALCSGWQALGILSELLNARAMAGLPQA